MQKAGRNRNLNGDQSESARELRSGFTRLISVYSPQLANFIHHPEWNPAHASFAWLIAGCHNDIATVICPRPKQPPDAAEERVRAEIEWRAAIRTLVR